VKLNGKNGALVQMGSEEEENILNPPLMGWENHVQFLGRRPRIASIVK